MPRANSLRRLSVVLGFGKPIDKTDEKLAEVKEEKKAEETVEPAAAAAEPTPAAADTATTDPVVEAQVKEAATAPIPGTGALAQFLTLSKQKYLNDIRANPPRGGQWTVAMGNEAGDLDSLVSAIAFAFHNSTKSTPAGTTPTIPLYQVASGDFKLRPENIYALSLAGITDTAAPETLFTLSDLPSPISPATFPSTKFALVDHNRLGSSFSYQPETANVTAVIDHHADEGLYKDASPRLIKPCGSCASHVATLFFPLAVELPPELATLLLTAILIDTDGLKVGGKAELDDVEAVLFLITRSTLSFSPEGNQLLENAEEILAKAKASAPGAAATSAEPAAETAAEGSKDKEKEKEKEEGEKKKFQADKDTWVKVQEALSEVPAIKSLAEELAAKKADVTDLNIRDLLRRDYKEYSLETPYIVESDKKKGKKKAKVVEKVEEKVEKAEGEAVASAAADTTIPPAPAPAPAPAPTPTTAPLLAGLASVPVSLEHMNSKGHFEKSLIEWMQERNITILGILSSFHTPQKDWDKKEKKKGKGKHRREMLWMILEPKPAAPPTSPDQSGGEASSGPVAVDAAGVPTTPPPPEVLVDYKVLSKKFWKGLKKSDEIKPKKSKAVKIDKKKLPKGVFGAAKVYEQGNVKANRKVTAPLMKALVEDKKVEEAKAE